MSWSALEHPLIPTLSGQKRHLSSERRAPQLPDTAGYGKYLFMETGAPTSGCKKGPTNNFLTNKWQWMQAVANNRSL